MCRNNRLAYQYHTVVNIYKYQYNPNASHRHRHSGLRKFRWFVLDPGDEAEFGSRDDTYLFTVWGCNGLAEQDIKFDLEGVFAHCGLMDYTSIQVDPEGWGTAVTWSNGRNYWLSCACVRDDFLNLGFAEPDCNNIAKGSSVKSFLSDGSASAEMDYVYDNWPSSKSSPYPVSTGASFIHANVGPTLVIRT
ncbi:hypothetical protein N7454_004467 [Penicillium verhagenii]|nr:hypothetical protein N7454_004467 [Penicillium verhagenii]